MDQSNPRKRYYQSLQRGVNYVGSFVKISEGSNLANRTKVEGFSNSSRKRLQKYLRNSEAEYRVFLTLTYPPESGQVRELCKANLRAFAARYRRYVYACARALARTRTREIETTGKVKSWSMAWWQEWQANGRLHYHVLGTNYLHHEMLSLWWYEIVNSKNPDHRSAGTSIEKIRGGRAEVAHYAAKYASKTEQKNVPKDYGDPGRFWGVVGLRSSVAASMVLTPWQLEDPEIMEMSQQLQKLKKEYMNTGRMQRIKIEKEWGVITKYCWNLMDDKIRTALWFEMAEMKSKVDAFSTV